MIAFTPTEWSSWLTEVVRETPSNTNGAVEVVVGVQGSWIVHSTRTAEQILFSHGEVEAFRHGVLAGEFDRDAMLNDAGLLAQAS
ncbi:hypothetical protein SAMN04488074_13625 [Lentzea albidocapillata subsp. violacea]|uniref:Uncharacterized protein n=1 Tax=Lentzea albidocapillata subsp. violacea TaxID=128104 RepID=A0A1G9YXT5_9PSEU|nr:hypothetical protein SAMN04488074_13625 [Lentzea albidocapillata subsp. violacea]